MTARQDQQPTPSPERGQDEPPPRELVLAALERHERPLLVLASRITGDPERARDVVQETFLELCRARRRDVEDHLSAWLHTVCRNRALDVRRKEGRMTELATGAATDRPDGTPGPAAVAEHVEDVGTVWGTLARLPERQREALELKFRHGLSYSEIAAAMQTSAGNVGWLLHHGLKALRERLHHLAPDGTTNGGGSLEGATR